MYERRKRRLPVQKPAVLIIEGADGPPQHGTTENVSESGALVLTEYPLPEGTSVRLIIILEELSFTGLRVSCLGRVVRTESAAMGRRIALAVRCSKALTEYVGLYGQVAVVAQATKSGTSLVTSGVPQPVASSHPVPASKPTEVPGITLLPAVMSWKSVAYAPDCPSA